MITIHEKTAKKFDTLGLGSLLPGSCVVKEEVNGAYELKMKHPYDEQGKWKRVERSRILYASTPRGMQPFRIYYVKPNMSNIEVNARHIFYDLLDNQCSEISFNGTASGALAALQSALAFAMPFSFATDISVSGTMKTGRMNPIQVLLSDDDEITSFVKGFGGELLRDGFKVSLLTAMGQDRDVAIRYGKNLVGLDVTEDEADVKTRIQYYGSDGSGILDSPFIGEYVYPKIYTLEDKNKTKAELKAEAQALFDGGADLPLVNIKVDFIVLADTVEYANYAPLEEVFLGDIVTIINQKMNFAKKARVISYEWDCLLEKYNEVELGDFMPTLASSVTSGIRSGSLASEASVTASAVAAALNSHMQDKDNPHEVTAEQTGGSSGESSSGILSGTDSPTSSLGNDGDVYMQVGSGVKHTVVEYLESTGTQYIDAEISISAESAKNIKVEIDTLIYANNSQYNLHGVGWGSAPYYNSLYLGCDTGGKLVYANGRTDMTTGVAYDFTRRTFTYDAPNGKVAVSGLLDLSFTFQNPSEALNFLLFAYNQGTTGIKKNKSRVYASKMHMSGSLVRNYIPVKDASGVGCLYDQINDKYYYNAGTGSFVVGPDIQVIPTAGTLWLKQNGKWIQVLKGAA